MLMEKTKYFYLSLFSYLAFLGIIILNIWFLDSIIKIDSKDPFLILLMLTLPTTELCIFGMVCTYRRNPMLKLILPLVLLLPSLFFLPTLILVLLSVYFLWLNSEIRDSFQKPFILRSVFAVFLLLFTIVLMGILTVMPFIPGATITFWDLFTALQIPITFCLLLSFLLTDEKLYTSMKKFLFR
jgi:hypothetical protein